MKSKRLGRNLRDRLLFFIELNSELEISDFDRYGQSPQVAADNIVLSFGLELWRSSIFFQDPFLRTSCQDHC